MLQYAHESSNVKIEVLSAQASELNALERTKQ
jgi:hypothetical protein